MIVLLVKLLTTLGLIVTGRALMPRPESEAAWQERCAREMREQQERNRATTAKILAVLGLTPCEWCGRTERQQPPEAKTCAGCGAELPPREARPPPAPPTPPRPPCDRVYR